MVLSFLKHELFDLKSLIKDMFSKFFLNYLPYDVIPIS